MIFMRYEFAGMVFCLLIFNLAGSSNGTKIDLVLVYCIAYSINVLLDLTVYS